MGGEISKTLYLQEHVVMLIKTQKSVLTSNMLVMKIIFFLFQQIMLNTEKFMEEEASETHGQVFGLFLIMGTICRMGRTGHYGPVFCENPDFR